MCKPKLEAWKRLYLFIGMQEFSLHDITEFDFMQESFENNSRFFLQDMIEFGYIDGDTGQRKFTQKFIDELILNE